MHLRAREGAGLERKEEGDVPQCIDDNLSSRTPLSPVLMLKQPLATTVKGVLLREQPSGGRAWRVGEAAVGRTEPGGGAGLPAAPKGGGGRGELRGAGGGAGGGLDRAGQRRLSSGIGRARGSKAAAAPDRSGGRGSWGERWRRWAGPHRPRRRWPQAAPRGWSQEVAVAP